eukprot:747601_1
MGVFDNLPCDCAALGTIAAIVGLALNIYSSSEIELAEKKFGLTCGWNEAEFSVAGDSFIFPYSDYTKEEGCIAEDAINSQDFPVIVCDQQTFIVGIVYLVCGILGTLITTVSVMSQAPKFAAKKTTVFRIGLFISGFLYIAGSYAWWQFSKCNEYHELARQRVGVGISWYLIGFGGVFNMMGAMLAFKNPDERHKSSRKAKKRRKQRKSTNFALITAATTSLMSKDSMQM